VAKNFTVLANLDAHNLSKRLYLQENAQESKLFANISDRMRYFLQKSNVVYFNHWRGIDREQFSKNKALNEFFNVLTYNYDLAG